MTGTPSARRILRLRLQAEFEIAPTAPFHFVGTVDKPSHFPSSDAVFDGKVYRQTMRLQGKILGIRMQDVGDREHPLVGVSAYAISALGDALVRSLKQELTYRFDLNADLADFARMCRKDAVLAPVYRRWRGMRISAALSLYEFLVIATVLQNATARRSVQMLEALFRNVGSRTTFAGGALSAFWDATTLNMMSEERLRDLKLGYRARTLKRQAGLFAERMVDEESLRQLPSDDLRAALLALYGVGPASAGYLMFDVFKRYDAFVYISPWEQKIFSRLLFDKELVSQASIMSHIDKRWGRWKYLAAHYLFEDLFWRRHTESIPWLDGLIRL